MTEPDSTELQFKQVIHSTAGKICKEVQQETGVAFSKQAIAALSEACYRQAAIFAEDLELFTKHARRKKVSPDDVLMLARRTAALHKHLESMKK